MKKLSYWRCFRPDARSLEGSLSLKDFDIFYLRRSVWQVKEQTWHDSGQNIISVMCSAQRDESLTRK
ncbi:hypothetical protein E2C01_059717 [Portunus trituberculatus]|uniref:Uncharacterized protein n=1 Tax=Portunus trituberculatus TaxID=210409 RepID=A0A5B7H6Z5_PORTR|nr:hypothetical protein [Portunus trituberculatus]